MNKYPSQEEMWKRVSNDKHRVAFTLENYPQSRGDDSILEFWVDLIFYRVHILKDKMTFNQFRMLPKQETLARRRREWQEWERKQIEEFEWLGLPYPHKIKYLPTERVQKKRALRRAAYQEYYPHPPHTSTILDYI